MRERSAWLAGLALLAWALAACGGGDAPPAPATSTTPSLIAVTDGSAGVVILEWRGGPAGVLRWQHRQRPWSSRHETDAWSAWTDIPNSSASTNSYRVSGLLNYRTYEFEVRPWMSTGAGQPSDTTDMATPFVDDRGYVLIGSGRTILGGKTYRLYGYHIDIPAGMRLRIFAPPIGSSIHSFVDVLTKSLLELDTETGEFISYAIVHADRTVTFSRRDTTNDTWIVDTKESELLTKAFARFPKPSSADPWAPEANWDGVADQFDQIADSIRKAPPRP